MSEDGSRPGGPGFQHGSGEPAADDLVEQGGRHVLALPWRPSRGAAVLGAAALVVGLAAGYAAGDRHAASGARPPQRPSAAAAVLGPPVIPALTQTTGACSAQVGRQLQLGVQVTNQSGVAVTLGRVEAVLPLGGLRVVSQQWTPCGVIPAGPGQSSGSLAPGASTWFTVTFKVLMTCPGPLPVQFTVHYDWRGQGTSASLPGFSDLSEVPYTGCSAT
jgi:hypothetical protein